MSEKLEELKQKLEVISKKIGENEGKNEIFYSLNQLQKVYESEIKLHQVEFYNVFYRAKVSIGEYEEAKSYYLAQLNDPQSSFHINAINCLCHMLIEFKLESDYESLVIIVKKFLNNNNLTKINVSNLNFRLGQLYTVLDKVQEALIYFEKAIEFMNQSEKNNQSAFQLYIYNLSKANCFIILKKYNEAKQELYESILLMKNERIPYSLRNFYLDCKQDYYYKTNQFKKAYLTMSEYCKLMTNELTNRKIEEIKKHEHNIVNEKLKYENQLLSQKSETKDQLLSQLSHEIRTPLSIILGNTKQLISEIHNTKSNEKVKSIHRNSLNLMNQIDAVLEYNKLESGVQNNKLADCAIIRLIKNCIQDFSILTQSKSIEVRFKANIKEATIQIDTEKLQKILNNLLSNATKYNVEHGQIWVDLKWTKTNLQIEIKDTGIGIAAEHLPHLFDKYYQVKQDKFVEGFGIGLNVVHSLVKTMQGDIKVESTINQGSCFTLSIPITSSNQVEKGKTEFINKYSSDTEPSLAKTITINQEKPSILLVEDNRELRQFIKGFLTADYNCIEAVDGEEAYSLVLEHDPDIIVSDYMMPRMDGIELLEKLRENPETNHHSFVMLTADNLEKTKLSIIKKGADAFITKPFNEEELSSILHNIIQKQEALRSRFNSQNISKNSPKKHLSKNEQFIHELVIVLETQYSNEDLNVDMLCEMTHLSKASLQRKTKSILKESPVEVITNFRLQKAKSLLESNTANVNEIAYQCGFNTPQYFSTSFKKKYGITPKQVMKE